MGWRRKKVKKGFTQAQIDAVNVWNAQQARRHEQQTNNDLTRQKQKRRNRGKS